MVRYLDAVTQLADGDLLAVKGKSAWSRAIQLRTFSRISHVGLAIWSKDFNQWCLLEAKEKIGVRLFPLRTYLQCNPGIEVVWYELLADKYNINREDLIEWSKKQWGKKYASTFQFLRSWGSITRRIADLLNVPLDTDSNRFFCSEFIAGGLEVGGFSIHKDPAQTDPGDLVELPCYHAVGSLVL